MAANVSRRGRAAVLSILATTAVLLPTATGHAERRTDVTATASGTVAAEHTMRRCANRLRRRAGLPMLRYDADLALAARRHAKRMAARGFFDHTDDLGRGPAERVERLTDRFGDFVGENIAAGNQTAAGACHSWFASPGHRDNILYDEYTHIGTGFARGGQWGRYYVQVFGGEQYGDDDNDYRVLVAAHNDAGATASAPSVVARWPSAHLTYRDLSDIGRAVRQARRWINRIAGWRKRTQGRRTTRVSRTKPVAARS